MQSPLLIQSNQENHWKPSYLGLAVWAGGVSGRLGRHSTRSPSVFDLQIIGKRQSRLVSL